jgi:uncharacterized protein
VSEARRRWFLPDAPDILGLLRRQVAVTTEGLDAFAAWAGGDEGAGAAVEDAERRGNAAKRDLLNALREAFISPLEPEDVFMLSRGLDWILNYTRNLVKESEVLSVPPDSGIAEMAGLLGKAIRSVDEAIAHLGSDPDAATAAAEAAVVTERDLERIYYRGMATLLEVKGMRGRVSSRELYRRCTRIGEVLVDVAERVAYAVVKQT